MIPRMKIQDITEGLDGHFFEDYKGKINRMNLILQEVLQNLDTNYHESNKQNWSTTEGP